MLVADRMKTTKQAPKDSFQSIEIDQLNNVIGGCACGCGQANCGCANGSCGGATQRQQVIAGR